MAADSFFVRGGSFYKSLALIALPVAAQNIITFSVSLADNVMVGSLGETSLSGVYLASQITTFLQMLTLGLSAAMTVLAAQYWGRGDGKSVKCIVGIALRAAVAVSLILWGAVFFFPERVLSLFGSDAAIIAEGVRYIRILSFSYVFFCVTNVLIAAMRCVRIVRAGVICSSAAFVINVSLNYVLIYGKLGLPALGVRGAAIATLVTRIIECAIILVFVAFFDDRLKIKPRELFVFDKRLELDFLRYGVPVILGDMLWGVNLAVQGAIVGRLGEITISAVSVANTVHQVVSVAIFGMREASSVTVGAAVGRMRSPDDTAELKQYARTLQVIFVSVGAITCTLLFFARSAILSLWTGLDAATIAEAKQLMTVMCVTLFGTSYEMSVLTGIVRAGGSTKFVLINDIIFVWLIVIPSSALAAFVFNAPAWVVYACLKCDQVLKCAVAAVKVNRWDWMKNLTLKHGETDSAENK